MIKPIQNGTRFGKLVVIEPAGFSSRGIAKNGYEVRDSLVKCKCDCGEDFVVPSFRLRRGMTQSCGCTNREVIEMVGQKFGRLTVVARVGRDKKRNATWSCKCDCGKKIVTAGAYLRNGDTKSCGCLNQETRSENGKKNRTHGMTRTFTGHSWHHMMNRCFNPENRAYKDYGGRGIAPCEFIKTSPLNLASIIGERPSCGVSIERIDNDLGYYCGQCEDCLKHGWSRNVTWATPAAQASNKRNTRLITFNGETHLMGEWAKILGISISGVRDCAGLLHKGSKPRPGWSSVVVRDRPKTDSVNV